MCINDLNLKMLLFIKLQLNIYTNIAIRRKKKIKNNEMKHSFIYRSMKEIFQRSSKHNIVQKNINNQLHELKTNKYRQQQKFETMDNHNKNQTFLENYNGENGAKSIEKRLDKENYFKSNKYDGNADNNNNKTFDSIITPDEADYKINDVQLLDERYNGALYDLKENKKTQNPHTKPSNDHGGNSQYEHSLFASYNQYPLHINISNQTCENIDPEKVRDILLAEGDGEVESVKEVDNNNEARSSCIDDILVNNISQNKLHLIDRPEEQNENNITLTKNEKSQSQQPLAAYVETQTLATAHVQNVKQHLNQRHLVTDLRQQIHVRNNLDVAGNLCAVPIGALCDMAAFSKLDCSLFGDFKDQDFLVKKYYHPLYAHGVCRWPGCELPLDDMASFVKHLKTEHCLDDRSTAQARVQMQVVSQLEMHLQKERDRLQAMMHHLYLTKHFVMPEETQENISHIRYKNAIRSVSTTPDLNKSNNNSNDDSDGANDLQTFLINSGNMTSTRKRICDKSPLALAGGLPYMLERAGLDVQQEIQRNREFYKNADVRPPFTYASLIRQSIIESPDKQLTLNEIYNWFQNTFCYFRRNAATWKNAVRHNLSLHKCFMRVENVKGAVWTVDELEFYKRRPQRSTTAAAAAAVVFASSSTSSSPSSTANASSSSSIVGLMNNSNVFSFGSISGDALLNSPTGKNSNNGRYSPNIQNMWSFGSSLSDDVSSAEFSCINNDRYRNFVTGLHLQSLSQRHHNFHQQKSSAASSHRVHPKTQQHISNQQHDVRSLHQNQGYSIYHTSQEEHQKLLLNQQNHQPLAQDIFAVNSLLNNTDKYFDHNLECHNDGEGYSFESFNARKQQQYLSIRHHPHTTSRSELSSEEISNNIYIQHQHNGHKIDVKYTPPHKIIYNYESQSLSAADINQNKRSVDNNYSNTNQTADIAAEEDSGIVDCDGEEILRKRKKSHIGSSMDYEVVEVKAEADPEVRNIGMPLRTKSY